MIHVELGPSTVLGVGLSIIGLLLYLLKTKRPDISRDYDILFSSIGFLCGGILIFQGWRLDPILLLCQILLSGTVIFFVGESLWLRSIKGVTSSDIYTIKPNKINDKFQTKPSFIKLWRPNSNFKLLSCKHPHYKYNYYNNRLLNEFLNINNWAGIDYSYPIDYKDYINK